MAHKHAELMLQYVKDAKTNSHPWELWQFKVSKHSNLWFPLTWHPSWDLNTEYRRIPSLALSTRSTHIELIEQYAQDAQTSETPWEFWEELEAGSYIWRKCNNTPKWLESSKYRRMRVWL